MIFVSRLRKLTIIRFIFGWLVLSLSGYGLWTEDFRVLPVMLLMLGFLMFVTGTVEIEKRKRSLFDSSFSYRYRRLCLSFLYICHIKGKSLWLAEGLLFYDECFRNHSFIISEIIS